MDEIKGYVLSGDSSVLPDAQRLARIVERYPWFTTARAAKCWREGAADALLALSMTGKPLPRIFLKAVAAKKSSASLDIIESFLERGEYRITPQEGSVPEDVADITAGRRADDYAAPEPGNRAAPAFDDKATPEPDDHVTEQMAEIYLAQGHLSRALAIYNKLCLLLPKKSVYFAQIIADLEERIELGEGAAETKCVDSDEVDAAAGLDLDDQADTAPESDWRESCPSWKEL